jgi:hypothetical protein
MIQVQGLFNLIAQRDQVLSVGMARDTKKFAEDGKRDSKYMKAVAAAIIFLSPWTFAVVSSS